MYRSATAYLNFLISNLTWSSLVRCDGVVSVSDCGHKNIRKSPGLVRAPQLRADVFVTVQCPLLALLSLSSLLAFWSLISQVSSLVTPLVMTDTDSGVTPLPLSVTAPLFTLPPLRLGSLGHRRGSLMQ